jgi:cell wall-associated NlpC family hydrolase
MPNTCERTTSIEVPDDSFAKSFLSRRNFVGYASAAAIAIGLANVMFPSMAYAVTSAEKQAEADAVKRKMDDWDEQLNHLSNVYYDAMDAHDQAVERMNEAQRRIDAAVARQHELQAMLGARARSMYKQGPLSFLDVIFSSTTFVEFSTSWDMLNAVNNRDAEMIAECEAARAEAEAAREEYSMQEQIAAQKLAEAEEALREGQAIMRAYEAELAKLEAEVRELIAEERRREEEERARREAEERARQQAQSQSSGGGNPGGYVPYDGSSFGSIVEAAMSRLGCPYIWAATGPNEFDCSGLTSWCYRQVGKYIPRGGNAQYSSAPMRHSVSDAQPGDILWKYNHVGLYIGGGQFIHAPRPGDVVRIANVSGYGWSGASRW